MRLTRKKPWLQVRKAYDRFSFGLPCREEEHSSLQNHFLVCDVEKRRNFYTRNSVLKSTGKAKITCVKSSPGNP